MPATATPNTSKTKLYDFDNSDETLRFGAPRLVPKLKTGVNITADFPWTTLPKHTRVNVPSITMREYRINSSTLIQSFTQQARSAVDAVGGAGENIVKGAINGVKVLGAQITDEEVNSWLNKTYNVSDQTFLDPYRHLYPVTPTNWVYTFPFLTNQNQKTKNSWGKDTSEATGGVGQSSTKGVGEGAVGVVRNFLEVGAKTAKVFNVLEPGSHTEQIKHYTPSDGESYRVQFTLYNTMSFQDIQKNWELCFVLTYQNRPNRRSVSLLDPPCIYNVTIPGVNQFLYAYIENLDISNLGTSRYVELDIGQKLIPEAYQVSFDVKSLLTPTQNLMLYAHIGSKIEVDIN